MAKKKATTNKVTYEYVRAIRDADGNLRWEYKTPGGKDNVMTHDEDVSDFSTDDIVNLTRSILSMGDSEQVEVCDE